MEREMTTSPIVTLIHAQRHMLLGMRAYFPSVSQDMTGQREIRLPSFHARHAHHVAMTFSDPLDHADIGEIAGIGHWLLQNYVIRLCALLEQHGVVPAEGQGGMRAGVAGHDHVEMLRTLRGVFAGSDGGYDGKSPEDRALYERIVKLYSLAAESAESASEYPLDIDKVLQPMTEGCIAYVHEREG
jgi:hypothetical protein